MSIYIMCCYHMLQPVISHNVLLFLGLCNCYNFILGNSYIYFAVYLYSTNHVYLHRPNAFGFWQMRLHLCYETLKRISNFSELA